MELKETYSQITEELLLYNKVLISNTMSWYFKGFIFNEGIGLSVSNTSDEQIIKVIDIIKAII